MTFNMSGLKRKFNRAGTEYYENDKGEIIAKQCLECSSLKIIEEFNSYIGSLGGREARCRTCRAATKREWRKTKQGCSNYRSNEAERSRKYYRTNSKERMEYIRKWREDNPEKEALIALRRRARKRSLPHSITEEEWETTLKYFNGGCALTGETYEIHRDHVIPLSTGHGGTIVENLIPLRADLNITKNNRNIFEWFSNNKEHFELEQRKFDELVEYLADTNNMTPQEYEEYVQWCHDNPRTVDEIKPGKGEKDAND